MGVGKYLEERRNILRGSINIINQKRIYHLGLDIIVPYNSVVFCPLDGYIHKLGKETQKGNYGGYLVIKHEIKDQTFYSLYGHLKTPHKVQLGQKILAGQELGRIGKESDSGGWFCHLHLQIITQKAMNKDIQNGDIFLKNFSLKLKSTFLILIFYLNGNFNIILNKVEKNGAK